MSDIFDNGSFVRALGLALVYFVWQGAVIWTCVAIALRLVRHASSRYVIASTGLVALVMTPIITAIRHYASGAPLVLPAVSSSSGGGSSAEPATITSVAATGDPELWLPLVVILWSAGACLLAMRLVANAMAVHRLRLSAGVPSSTWETRARRIASGLGVSRPFAVVESLWVDVPTVIGWIKPMIIVPTSTLAGLTPAMVDAILAHEIAHIRRHDYLVHALQHVAETLLFYHPAVWWVSNRMRVERELCCDDVAVGACGDRSGYARALMSLEELRASRHAFAVGAASGDLLSRVRYLLGHRESAASPLVFLTTVATIGIVLAIAVNGTQAAGAEVNLSGMIGAPVQQERDAAAFRAEIERLETMLRDATIARDGATLDRLFSATFVAIGPDGTAETKAATIGKLLALPARVGVADAIVRAMADAAIVTGRETQTTGSGTAVRRFTRVWDRESDGAWRVTSITTTDVRQTGQATHPSPAPVPNRQTPAETERLAALREHLTVLGARATASRSAAGARGDQGGDQSAQEMVPIHVGRDVPEPKRILHVAPVYPLEAKLNGIQGIVIAEATINPDGSVRDVVILRSIPLLDGAAADAIRQWRYMPPGVPIVMTVTVNFSLRDQSGDTSSGGGAPMPAAETSLPNAPQLLRRVNPQYTREALDARVEGTVVAEVTVGRDGSVSDARVVRSVPLLDEAALAAVKQWRFSPVEAPVTVTVELEFKLR